LHIVVFENLAAIKIAAIFETILMIDSLFMRKNMFSFLKINYEDETD